MNTTNVRTWTSLKKQERTSKVVAKFFIIHGGKIINILVDFLVFWLYNVYKKLGNEGVIEQV